MSGDPVVAEARTWIGTPFVHQGRIKGVGVDCAGLVKECARACGKHYIDVPGYGVIPTGNALKRLIEANADKVPLSEIAPGDFYLMSFRRNPQHLAIWSGNSIIHAWRGAGKCVEHRMDAAWRRRIVGAYRLRNG